MPYFLITLYLSVDILGGFGKNMLAVRMEL
jgi:hypothetical protein